MQIPLVRMKVLNFNVYLLYRYKHYEEQLTKTKASNRETEKEFVADVNDITPGTEWERVSKLCDFNAKTNKNAKDMSRMRSILLQLKQSPLEKKDAN